MLAVTCKLKRHWGKRDRSLVLTDGQNSDAPIQTHCYYWLSRTISLSPVSFQLVDSVPTSHIFIVVVQSEIIYSSGFDRATWSSEL